MTSLSGTKPYFFKSSRINLSAASAHDQSKLEHRPSVAIC